MSYNIVILFVMLFIIIITFMILLVIVMVRNSKKRSMNYIRNTNNANNTYGRMNMSMDVGKPSGITYEKCNVCGYTNSSEWSFCPNCGNKKENESLSQGTKKCVNCGKEFSVERFFCDACGGKLE